MFPSRILCPVLIALITATLLPLADFSREAHAQAEEQPQVSIAPATSARTIGEEYGAIAFTPDGSFFSVWKIGSRLEAEEKVRAECAEMQRGNCEAVSFSGQVCAAIASGSISKQRKVTYSGGGLTPGDAEQLALSRCNADRRARGTCQLRTTVCGDGRIDSATARAP